jgi:choline-glycine betaine transporter
LQEQQQQQMMVMMIMFMMMMVSRSRCVGINNWLRQASPVSLILFSIYADDSTKEWQEETKADIGNHL